MHIKKKFGRLTVISKPFFKQHKQQKHPFVKVLCTCKTIKEIRLYDLKKGKIQSCGCLQLERVKRSNTIHGLYKHPLYKVWKDMKARCYNKNNANYNRYGGRGITIYTSWKTDFLTFYTWAILHEWKKGLTIDRIDNNGNYGPKNCRWATRKEQVNNTSANLKIIAFGETKNLLQWAKDPRCKISRQGLKHRLDAGIQPEAAITTPSKRK